MILSYFFDRPTLKLETSPALAKSLIGLNVPSEVARQFEWLEDVIPLMPYSTSFPSLSSTANGTLDVNPL
nr:MAG TPA: hypothetical protein [Caudoviricetes sp.]